MSTDKCKQTADTYHVFLLPVSISYNKFNAMSQKTLFKPGTPVFCIRSYEPRSPQSMRNAPYAVVAVDSGVESISASVTPQRARVVFDGETSFRTSIIVFEAACISGNEDDFATRSLTSFETCVHPRGERSYP